jgi:hypothetical protein
MKDTYARAHALTALAGAAARGGDRDRASRLTTDAEALARTLTDRNSQVRVLTTVATAAFGAPAKD